MPVGFSYAYPWAMISQSIGLGLHQPIHCHTTARELLCMEGRDDAKLENLRGKARRHE